MLWLKGMNNLRLSSLVNCLSNWGLDQQTSYLVWFMQRTAVEGCRFDKIRCS